MIEFSLSGALGKRTQFQTKDVAQILLRVTRIPKDNKDCNHSDDKENPETLDKSMLPKVCKTFPFLIVFPYLLLLVKYTDTCIVDNS